MKIVLVTGGFDPLHSGHIAYFKEARTLGDKLIVGLNSDEWLERKKGRAFMPWNERLCVINNLSMVDEVYTFDDEDDSAKHFIQQVQAHYPGSELIFANGGDRTANNIPEMTVKDVTFKFGVGGKDKKNSSSWILEEWKSPKTERPWGHYRVLYEIDGTKVKELTVMPGQSLSLQRHKFRKEFWHVTNGICNVHLEMSSGYALPARTLYRHDRIDIPDNEWHRLSNPYASPCKIIEIQFGSDCDEADIERK
jgi:cytidyltransferase-like protein